MSERIVAVTGPSPGSPSLQRRIQKTDRHSSPHDRNVATLGALLSLSEIELSESLNLSVPAARALRADAALAALPPTHTALELLAATPAVVPTGLPALDAALGGGLPGGHIVEAVGPPGQGKTQLCLGCAVRAALPTSLGGCGGSVLYLDTEAKFSAARLAEIAVASMPPGTFGSASSSPEAQRVAALAVVGDRVVVATETCPRALLARTRGLQRAVIDRGVALVIVDSVAAAARAPFSSKPATIEGGAPPASAGTRPDPDDRRARAETLAALARVLKTLADDFGIPVLVTNQIVASSGGADDGSGPSVRPGGAGMGAAGTGPVAPSAADSSGAPRLVAALGPGWAHAVNSRLVLETRGGGRWCLVAKSPSSAAVAVPFVVNAAGVVADPLRSVDDRPAPGRVRALAEISAEPLPADPGGAGGGS